MAAKRLGGMILNRFVPVLLAVFLGGCAVPLGHREGRVDFGFQGPWYGRVEKGSLAERIGMKPGFQVISINGAAVQSPADIQRISESLRVGDKVEIRVSSRTQQTPNGQTVETLRGAVEESDIGKSSNYVVYGYEKVGDRTRRSWVHLGVISFGDWTGNMTGSGLRSRGVHVDSIPERIARGAAVVAYLIPKYLLLGLDVADQCSMITVRLPTVYLGEEGKTSLANALLLTSMWGEEGRVASLWPVGGYVSLGEDEGEFVYLTPFNSVGWGGDECQGVTVAGLAYWRPEIKGLLPLFSYVNPKGG